MTETVRSESASPLVCTIGHSTRLIDEFVGLLNTHGITHLLDVRTVPRSRYNPQFSQNNLRDSLESAGIRYTHLPALGGLRHPRPDSVNTGWRNASFRGYADYMQTPEFEGSVLQVIDLALVDRCVLMCAEKVPWRCHRSLVADALCVRGVRVEDIIDGRERSLHRMTPFARIDGVRITYPVASDAGSDLFEADTDRSKAN